MIQLPCNMRLNWHIFPVAALLLLQGCSVSEEEYMAFDDVTYVTSFKNSLELDKGKTVDLGLLGMLDIYIHNSLMYISTQDKDGYVTVVSLPDLTSYGKFIKNGNGPIEATSAPFFSGAIISGTESGERLIVKAGDKMLSLNAGTPFDPDNDAISVFKDNVSNMSFYSIQINDSTTMTRNVKWDRGGQERSLVINGNTQVVPSMEKLNRTEIPIKGDGYLFNVMSSFAGYDKTSGKVVEASININNINVYSLSGDFEKTICYGKRLDNIAKICNSPNANFTKNFTDLRLYDDFFAVAYSGRKEFADMTLVHPDTRIMFFNWDCTPLAEIRIPSKAGRFDIDFNNSCLYTLDSITDEIITYDIPDFLLKLKTVF